MSFTSLSKWVLVPSFSDKNESDLHENVLGNHRQWNKHFDLVLAIIEGMSSMLAMLKLGDAYSHLMGSLYCNILEATKVNNSCNTKSHLQLSLVHTCTRTRLVMWPLFIVSDVHRTSHILTIHTAYIKAAHIRSVHLNKLSLWLNSRTVRVVFFPFLVIPFLILWRTYSILRDKELWLKPPYRLLKEFRYPRNPPEYIPG